MPGDEEIGVGGPVPAPDAPAELVEIAEAVGIGPIDQDRIGIRDIDSVFDEGCGEEEIELSRFKLMEDGVDLIGVHLPMDDPNAGRWDELLDTARLAVDALDAVVDEVGLSASRKLSHKRVLH